MGGRSAIAALIVAIAVATMPAPAAGAGPEFDDVPEGAWYAEAVAWAASVGITEGTGERQFSPRLSVTTAQIATMLWRLAGEPMAVDHPYADVPDGTWFDRPASWMRMYQILDETGLTFGPAEEMTRGEIAEVLYRHQGSPLYLLPIPFVDVPEAHEHRNAVAYLWYTGVSNGTSATTFSPDEPVTRAELVTLLWRWVRWPTTGEHAQIEPNVDAWFRVELEPGTGESLAHDALGVVVLEPLPDHVTAVFDPDDAAEGLVVTAAEGVAGGRYEVLIAVTSCSDGTSACGPASYRYSVVALTIDIIV